MNSVTRVDAEVALMAQEDLEERTLVSRILASSFFEDRKNSFLFASELPEKIMSYGESHGPHALWSLIAHVWSEHLKVYSFPLDLKEALPRKNKVSSTQNSWRAKIFPSLDKQQQAEMFWLSAATFKPALDSSKTTLICSYPQWILHQHEVFGGALEKQASRCVLDRLVDKSNLRGDMPFWALSVVENVLLGMHLDDRWKKQKQGLAQEQSILEAIMLHHAELFQACPMSLLRSYKSQPFWIERCEWEWGKGSTKVKSTTSNTSWWRLAEATAPEVVQAIQRRQVWLESAILHNSYARVVGVQLNRIKQGTRPPANFYPLVKRLPLSDAPPEMQPEDWRRFLSEMSDETLNWWRRFWEQDIQPQSIKEEPGKHRFGSEKQNYLRFLGLDTCVEIARRNEHRMQEAWSSDSLDNPGLKKAPRTRF